ncbi:hypothetical protein RQP46_005818 [Phenoliferia psychrophenolica]
MGTSYSYHEWVGPPEASRFNPQSAVQVAARSLDGKDVVIRCLTRAGEGHNVVAILDALSSPEALLDPSNHTLPMIEKLEMEDMTFGVIPVMRPNGLTCIWFRTTDEVFRALEAVLEGFVYLHDRLIAHRDFGLAEIFINHGSSYGRMPYDPSRPPSRRPCEWRSLFKSPQYYINDYEWSVQFSPDSSESSMLVQGFPLQAYGITLDEYKRPIPPEVLTGEPYCPFRMDVFQLGTSLHRIFHHMSRVPELVTLLSDMADDDPLKRPTAREAHDRLLEIPSLMDWRYSTEGSGGERAIWEPLVPFLREHGYELFVPRSPGYREQIPPPGSSPFRAPDPYHEWVGPPEASRFNPQSAIQVAARSIDGKDVVIRCLTRAGEGHNVVAILELLSSPEALLDPSNHTLPMIDKLELEDMVFGVFPMMRPRALTCIWFRTTDEVFKALDEVLEGFVYLHDRLIAHRDFGLAEIFINHGSSLGPMPYDPSIRGSRRPSEWRSLFKNPRYYINDYEWSVQFSPESSESSRMVQGIPLEAHGLTLAEYQRAIPPEVRTGQPYCPFHMDVFQLGSALLGIFQYMSRVPDLVTLLTDMADDDPLQRSGSAELEVDLLPNLHPYTPAPLGKEHS